ncbi:GGDEF domain-containing protein [Eilatimonas milleporae]|uniref:GGDEF domain-containing protein n=1 Tax=Eilatimonas milleporae TaxID=911205 RepID=UPI000EF9C4CB|nr:GGDEF domain-containing protein [Eilatimonas milleporae]
MDVDTAYNKDMAAPDQSENLTKGKAFDLLPAGYVLQKGGRRGRIFFANDTAERFLGRPDIPLLHTGIFDHILPRDAARVDAALTNAVTSGKVVRLKDVRMTGAQGQLRFINMVLAPADQTPAKPVKAVAGVGASVQIVIVDRSEEKRREDKLFFLSCTDPLTGAQNRRSFVRFVDDVDQSLAGISAALIILDIDHFKKVNDTHGHDAGDEVLKVLVQRCEKILAWQAMQSIDDTMPAAMLARLGGEEFAVLAPGVNEEQAMELAETLRETVAAEPIDAGDRKLSVTISLGVAVRWLGNVDVDNWMQAADVALYQAKQTGRNRTCMADDGDCDPAALPEGHRISRGKHRP